MVAWISRIFAWVSLIPAVQRRNSGLGLLQTGDPFLVLFLGDFLLTVEPGQTPLLSLFLPLVSLGLLQLRLILHQLRLARSQERDHIVVFDDGERVAFLDLHPLVHVHPLDPAGDLGPDHRLGS